MYAAHLPEEIPVKKCTRRTRRTLLLIIAICCFSIFGLAQSTDQISISSLANADLVTQYTNGSYYPPHGGPLTVAGIPFTLATIPPNSDTAVIQGLTVGSEQSFSIPVNTKGVVTVYTLINSAFGSCGTIVGELDFVGASSSTYVYTLTEGDNIRDHNQDGFCNTAPNIVGTASFGGGQVRLDMQQVMLPASFANDTLNSITFKSYGLGYAGTPFIAAITTASSPQRPVVFIPGLTGSYLDDVATGKNIWPDRPWAYGDLSLFGNPSPRIKATDVIRSTLFTGPIVGPLLSFLDSSGYKEYDLNRDPARLTAGGCDTTQFDNKPNLFIFPYDWRQDFRVTAIALAGYIACVRQFYPGTKVNIVTGSAGALLARHYILDNGGSDVNALITLGVPWLGAPSSIHELETGQFLPRYLFADSTIKYILGSFDGAQELLPAQSYFDLGGQPLGEDGWDLNRNDRSVENYSSKEYRNLLDQRYGKSCPAPFCPGTTSYAFHAYTTPWGSEDDWRNDSTGVTYFQIFGQQDSDRTPGTYLARVKTSCILPKTYCWPEGVLEPKFTVGDGTVPLISASRTGNGLDINSPGTTSQCVPIGAENHTSMLADTAVLGFLKSFLDKADSPQSPADSQESACATTTKVVPNSQNSSEDTSEPYQRVEIYGATSFVVSDSQGNSTGLVPGTKSHYGSVPGVDEYILSPLSDLFVVPLKGLYTIRFRTTNRPLEIEIETGTPTNTSTAIRYVDTAVPSNVTAEMVFNSGAVGSLHLDTEGNDSFSTIVNPTLTLTGPEAQVAPPTISFHVVRQHPERVSITASSDGSALQDVFYSLNGRDYFRYIHSVKIDRRCTRDIYAFADDALGNRTSSVITLPPIAGHDLIDDHR